ncbi:VTT domain-containing protein [Actinomycetospora sp. NBRC 106378]|uniref:DedA family protein n=1 Tax=Actinomycetospora sp. NBRC 106378 TaxID=3032208 RepID=UPI0024A4B57D|nr:VTT domain-containing protein [Actinomycetospora sp. NBRC 106378]GLZ51167.1 cytochrome o ubiquinol oxidase [Actinomycetospora sp. NBRC 106378]
MTLADATTVVALGPQWLDPQYIIQSLGPWALLGVALILFAECGLLIGFFLPGDSLLFITGLAATTGLIETPLWLVCVVLVVAAFAGNVVGYGIGYQAGPAIFDKPNSKLFKRENVERTQKFFDKYGNRAIVLGRFVPIVRTFITVMAGVGRMDAKRFFTFSAIGAILWAAGVTLLGAVLGQFTFVKDNIELMLILVVVISLVPIAIEAIQARREKKLGASNLAEETLDGANADAPTQQIRRPNP